MARRWYFDTSAVAKLMLDERESDDVERWVDDQGIEPVSSMLLETELRRVAWQRGLLQDDVTAILAHFSLHAFEGWEWKAAGLIPYSSLRSLDALHLESALRLEADAMITYDDRMLEAAVGMGLAVIQPGRGERETRP